MHYPHSHILNHLAEQGPALSGINCSSHHGFPVMMNSIPLIVRENKAFIFCILLALNLCIVLRTANNKVFIHLESITAEQCRGNKTISLCNEWKYEPAFVAKNLLFFFFCFSKCVWNDEVKVLLDLFNKISYKYCLILIW